MIVAAEAATIKFKATRARGRTAPKKNTLFFFGAAAVFVWVLLAIFVGSCCAVFFGSCLFFLGAALFLGVRRRDEYSKSSNIRKVPFEKFHIRKVPGSKSTSGDSGRYEIPYKYPHRQYKTPRHLLPELEKLVHNRDATEGMDRAVHERIQLAGLDHPQTTALKEVSVCGGP